MTTLPPWGQWFFPPRSTAPGEDSTGELAVGALSQNSCLGPLGLNEDGATPFISCSERGDLLLSGDSEGSEEESAPPAKVLKLDEDVTVFLICVTKKLLEHETWKKLIAWFYFTCF